MRAGRIASCSEEQTDDRKQSSRAMAAAAAASSLCFRSTCSSSSSIPRTTVASPLPASSSSSAALASSSPAPFRAVQALLDETHASWSSSICHHERKYDFTINANVGEWGARDPTAAEVESDFGDKVLGNEGTEHIKLIPPSLLGLAERSCTSLAPGTVPLSEEEATALLRKVVGWRLAKTDTGLKIWTEWKLKDSEAGVTLFDRIAAVAEAEEQHPELHLQEINTARAELSTESLGGLSINDFIFAAKIDKIKTSDLVKKNRFWA